MTENNSTLAIENNRAKSLFTLLRPKHWVKNGFVFVGFFFAEKIGNTEVLLSVIFGALAFCLISSAVYILNDLVDLNRDKIHPKKQKRPLCSGDVSINVAKRLGIICGLSGLLLGFAVSLPAGLLLIGYLLLNICYTFRLKHVVLLDVFCIASGFMLRILVGTIGVGIFPSEWLLLCGLMLTLFLGFTKRRAEVMVLAEESDQFRKVLSLYSPAFLDELISICAAGVIISYSLYTMSPATIEVHHTTALFYTVPFVIYGIFRYLFLLHNYSQGEDPASDLIKDFHMVVCVLSWAALSIFIMHIQRG